MKRSLDSVDALVAHLRTLLADRADTEEKKMFGGHAFMVAGRMCCGVVREKLMIKLDRDAVPAALEEPHTSPMDFTGRVSRSMIYVERAGWSDPEIVDGWVARAVAWAEGER